MLVPITVLFIVLSFTKGNIYLYYTEDSSSVEYYDCIFHNTFVYCQRPSKPISLYRENNTWKCYHNGTRHSFSSMKLMNISVNTVVHEWRSTLEMAGKYARYKTKNDDENHLCQCNNNPQSFGKYCEYLLPIGNTFPETINGVIEIKKTNIEKTQIFSDIICYTTLECNSGLLCLDWRDICDGIQQCMFGYDEENCDKLEFNECEYDEYRCMNGMCIPNAYFLDGEYDCMDLTDEKGNLDDRICALQHVSLECDERVCPPHDWSCGDGQCIDDRLAFQYSPIISPTCVNRRDQYFMCETHQTMRMWTMTNGKCYTYDDYEENNRSMIDDCIYFIKCALSKGMEKNCPCKNDDICYDELKKFCLDPVIQYPNGAIIAPYIFLFYDLNRDDWHRNIPDIMRINGSMKCRGYIVNHQDMGAYLPKFFSREFEFKACLFDDNIRVFTKNSYDEFCYNDSRTFNNRSYNFIDICQESRECISAYRIRDGFVNCEDKSDEKQYEFVLNTCSKMKQHRFQCSAIQSTCFPVSNLGDLEVDCENKYDESWMGTETKLSKINCNLKSKDGCELIRQYIEASWNINYNSSWQLSSGKTILFRAYCDSFWDFYSKKDEDIRLCEKWWVCLDNQWRCRTGQCIDIAWVLDGEWDCSDASDEEALFISSHELLSRNFKLIDQLVINQTFERRYINRPLMNLCNPEKEFPCYQINSSYPFKNINSSRPCINLEKLGDGHIDCLGALDEQNTIDYCHRAMMLGRNFKCLSTDTCHSYSVICEIRCENMIDDNVLCYGQNRSPHCANSTADFTCFDGECVRGGRCNGKPECAYGEDEFLCNDRPALSTNVPNPISRTEKENSIQYENQLFRLPRFPIDTNRTVPNNTLPSTPPPETSLITNLSEVESSLIAYVCNRGIGVFSHNGSIVCFCPQQYYGDRCQYYNDRITFIFRLNFSQSIYTTASDPTLLLKMIVLFMYEDQPLSSYEFHSRPATEITRDSKKIDHVIYSRLNQSLTAKRKRYFNRSNIIHEHPYSVRIEAYHIKIAEKAQLIAVWQYLIYFDFLPSFRFSKVLHLTKPQMNGNPCSNNPCGKYQECHQLLNDKSKYICLCQDNYRGKNCSELDQICADGFCAVNAVCKPTYRGLLNRNELPYCICPRNTFGFRCHLLQDQCNSNPCQNNGTCYESATPGHYFCVCNSLYQGTRCELEKEAVRLYINKSVEHKGAVVQYFSIDFSDLELVLHHQQPYEKLPHLLFYRHAGKTAPEIIVAKVYSNQKSEIYLISIHTGVASINGTTELSENNRCLNVHTLFLTDEEISPFKYHQLCITNNSLLCFHDVNYLCVCDDTHSRAECFDYDHTLDRCSHCIAGGQCLKGDRLQSDDYICVCPVCHSGRFCQFSSESFSFTLDQLFSADLLSTKKVVRYSAIYSLIIGSSIVFLLGLVNNIFAFVTFRRPKCRRIGCGQYLLFMSIINQINLGLFTLRLIHLTINIISRCFHPMMNVILCTILNYLLTASSRITYWLVSLIAIERVYTTIFINKQWLKKPHIARRLIIVTTISILVTGAYELAFVTSHSGFNNGKSAICVLELPPNRSVWMYIHQGVTIINALLPFTINLCCMITITYVVIKKKMRVSRRSVCEWIDFFFEILQFLFEDSVSRLVRRLPMVSTSEISTLNPTNKTSKGNLPKKNTSFTDQHLTGPQSRFHLFHEIISENKELIIGPAFTLVPQLFSMPLFIASILLVCQTIETSPIRYLLIMSYFTSFIPQLISFFLYISPSTLYIKEWHATNLSKRIDALKQIPRKTK